MRLKMFITIVFFKILNKDDQNNLSNESHYSHIQSQRRKNDHINNFYDMSAFCRVFFVNFLIFIRNHF